MDAPRILLVRPGALGDTILTIPLLDTLSRQAPEANITFLGNRRYRALLPCSVAFHPFDASEWLWLFAGEDEELGEYAQPFDQAYIILTQPDDVVRNVLRAGTTVVRHAGARSPRGCHVVSHLHESFGFVVPEKRACLENRAPREKRDLIWVHPGSGGPSKCIPLSLMVSLVRTLRAWTGYTVVVTMAEEDAFLTEDPAWPSLVHDAGTAILHNLHLQDLCAEAGAARLFVGNDSGISHLAAALGVPATVFFTRTDPGQWAPWTEDARLNIVDLRGKDPACLDVAHQTRKILGLLNPV